MRVKLGQVFSLPIRDGNTLVKLLVRLKPFLVFSLPIRDGNG